MAKKKCTRCGKGEPLVRFYRSSQYAGSQDYYCTGCRKLSDKVYHQRRRNQPGYRQARRESNLRYLYGISLEEYAKLHRKQKGLCAICKKPETATLRGTLRELSVDHCHTTGHVRGLLCCRCNRIIGMVADDPQTLRRAIAYLTT